MTWPVRADGSAALGRDSPASIGGGTLKQGDACSPDAAGKDQRRIESDAQEIHRQTHVMRRPAVRDEHADFVRQLGEIAPCRTERIQHFRQREHAMHRDAVLGQVLYAALLAVDQDNGVFHNQARASAGARRSSACCRRW